MTTSGRNSQATPNATYTRPVASATKTYPRGTGTYAGVSFRSSLLRAQQNRSLVLPKATTTTVLPVRSSTSRLASASDLALDPITSQAEDGFAQMARVVPSSVAGARAPARGVSGLARSTEVNPLGPASRPNAIGRPMALSEFPRPEGDNGRGMHWIPTTRSSDDVVDRFVREAKEMKIKWMVILNDDAKIGENDYLVKQLVANGIMPIMRIYTPNGRPIQGDLEKLVTHYRQLGVFYYQLYNEPNLNVENPDGVPNVDRYLDKWIPAARAVVSAGGLPGFGSLAPGGNFDDIEFLKQAFDKVKQRGEVPLLDSAWLSMHNYTLNHPLDYAKDSNGFLKFKWYDAIVREKLGRQMPIIGTEGGTHIGSADDKTMPPIDQARQIEMVTGAYRYMKKREPYNFVYTYWIIANEEGGGADSAFSHQALFKRDGRSPLVDALKKLE